MTPRKSRILFADDNEDIRTLFVLLLTHLGYEVTGAASIESAASLSSSQHFDLMVLDWLFPDGSGLELCQEFRKTNQNTPIVFCTGMATTEDKRAAISAGAQAYLVKPVQVDEMCETIANLINREQRTFAISA